MKCLVYFIAIIGIVLAADVNIPPEPKPTLAPTTLKPNSTTTAPTTPSTTTTTTTTPAPTTTSTTKAPTTTSTTVPPTTTVSPSPTPAPEPKVGNWSWVDPKTNKTCIIVNMAVQLNVTYADKDNKEVYQVINLLPEAKAFAGSCGDEEQFIGLIWPSSINATKQNTVKFNFVQNTTTKFFIMNTVVVSLDGSELPNFKNENLNLTYSGSEIHAPLAMSYHCTRVQKFNMTEEGNKLQSKLEVSQLQVEAFHKDSSKTFSEAADCDAIDTPDVVPIAVGCALAALVIIVLVAYLVGRRRSQARGYLSM